MSIDAIERALRESVAAQVELREGGDNLYRVLTPFRFDDGDHFVIVLRRDGSQWTLSDEGHTYMHLTYHIDERDLRRGTRQKVISDALALFDVEDRGGELRLNVSGGQYGDALCAFVQALIKISDVSYLSRERVRSTFKKDSRALFRDAIPTDRRSLDWSDPQHDPDGIYTVDCRIDGQPRPLFVHALASESKTQNATITLHQFEKWGIQFQSLPIIEDETAINKKVLARFRDVCDEPLCNLPEGRVQIADYLEAHLSG